MERIGNIRGQVGEGPVWSAAEACWYWVDIPARLIWRLDAASGATRCWQTAEMPACLAPRAGGGLIAGMQSGLFHLQLREDGQVQAARLACPPELGEGMRFNDGRTDRQGRFWAGTMFMDMAAARAVGGLYRWDGSLSAPLVSGLLTQNGLAFSPDGRTLYLSDSHPLRQLVWAFDLDPASGALSRQRVLVDMKPLPGRPDGAAMDVDGCYWVCGNDGGMILRFSPEGRLVGQIAVPMAKPSMCAFGGARMDQLLVTSIAAGQPEDDPWAGAVLLIEAGVQGMADVPCAF
ncbi:SMP-30/gluconolactonase/LRE family protein [Massilia sp. TS11]|nr:SMP-30/gluconolactonase/LRE family protein [Massilia sp. TS11]MCG2583775.1 SMP-30/gluconolactonase/LRE family protein [Massilia sp. TS11]